MSQVLDGDLDRWAHAVLVAATGGTDAPPPWLLRRLERGLGGVCLFGRNIVTPEQVAGFVAALDAVGSGSGSGSGEPSFRPIVSIDEEGGDVTRLHHATGSPVLGALALGVVDDVEVTRATGHAIGSSLAALGIGMDLAPVADVNAEPDSPVIGVRSFGADPDLVSRHVAGYVRGLHDAGVLATAKHFPGHGVTAADSHTSLPVVRTSRADLDAVHLPPFAAAIAADVDAVMLGHLVVEAIDPALPASLSPALVRVLRDDLGFRGAIITDALEMRAVADVWTIPGAAVRAIAAGADLLCLSGDLHTEDVVDACVTALVSAVKDGALPAERLAAAAHAVAHLQARSADLRSRADSGRDPRTVAAQAFNVAAAADRSVRVRGDVALRRGALDVVVLDPAPNIAAGRVPWHPGELLAAARPGTTLRSFAEEKVSLGAPDVVLVRDLHRHPGWRAALAQVVAANPEVVVAELGVPVTDPGGRGWLCTHGASTASTAAAARHLLAGTSRG